MQVSGSRDNIPLTIPVKSVQLDRESADHPLKGE
jgi:hypothetical protein